MSIRQDALPELTTAWSELLQLLSERGIKGTIADYGGYRTQADTNEILGYRDQDYALYVAQTRAAGGTPVSENAYRPIAPYGSSAHNYGAARDLAITAVPPGMTASQALDVAGSLAMDAGLRWGGTFTNPDRPHFELPWSLSEWQSAWSDYQNETGEYAAGGNDASDSDSGPTPTPAGQATLVALVVVALGGGLWLLLRRVL